MNAIYPQSNFSQLRTNLFYKVLTFVCQRVVVLPHPVATTPVSWWRSPHDRGPLPQVVATYYGDSQQLVMKKNRSIAWAGGRTSPPPDKPVCGFDGSLCPDTGERGPLQMLTRRPTVAESTPLLGDECL